MDNFRRNCNAWNPGILLYAFIRMAAAQCDDRGRTEGRSKWNANCMIDSPIEVHVPVHVLVHVQKHL
jgi:hypothetical protein